MSQAIAMHNALLRLAVESNHGVVVKTVGDGMHASFEDPLDALNAAVAIQEQLGDPAATSGVPLRVRCGVHVGAAERLDNDYYGGVVNRAARIMSAAHGGQVLLSQTTVDLIGDRLPPKVSLRDLGKVRLRDISSVEPVFQLVYPGLRDSFPPLRTANLTPNNLPYQVTSFIGRVDESREIRELLETTRLLTLLGSGGIGKTRLAVHVGAETIDRYADGVWFVDLAPVVDSTMVPSVVAQVLSIAEEPGTPLVKTLAARLKSSQLLLILDNCEHLVEACARLASALMRSCVSLRILATSREALRTNGEQTYSLPVLAVPDPKSGIDTIVASDAVRLFIDRARLQRPDCLSDAEQLRAAARICSQLDGIPLAVELAAARVGALPIDKIAERLDDRFRLLTSGSRTVLPRQRTLRAMIDWSYDLLNPSEQALFARLSPFAGGWTLDAAEAVATDDMLPVGEVLDLLTALIDKSLVAFDAGRQRYRMLDTMRQYAHERLQESGTAARLMERYRDYFVQLVEEAQGAMRHKSEETAWLHRLELEHANIEIALQGSLEREENAASALRICSAFGHFWRVRGYWQEGSTWCAAALARDGGRTESAVTVRTRLIAGVLSARLGNAPDAQRYVREALDLSRRLGDQVLEAGALNNLSNLAQERGEFANAQRLLEQAVLINRSVGNHEWEVNNLSNLGYLHTYLGNLDKAQASLDLALVLSREFANRTAEAGVLGFLALLARNREQHDAARGLAASALAIYRELGAPAQEVDQLQLLADLAVVDGELDRARLDYRQIVTVSRDLGYRDRLRRSLYGIAVLATAMHCHDRGATFCGAGDALKESVQMRIMPAEAKYYDLARKACRSALGDSAYDRAHAAGYALPLSDAVAEALHWLSSSDAELKSALLYSEPSR